MEKLQEYRNKQVFVPISYRQIIPVLKQMSNILMTRENL